MTDKADVKPRVKETLDLNPTAIPKQGSKDGNSVVTDKVVKPSMRETLDLNPTALPKTG